MNSGCNEIGYGEGIWLDDERPDLITSEENWDV